MTYAKMILEFLLSGAGQSLLLWLLGLAVAYVQGSKYLQGSKDKQLQDLTFKAYKMLETCVNAQYDKVRQLKAQRPDGKLTQEDMDSLEKSVVESLKTLGEDVGVDALPIIGEKLISVAIVHTVRRLKGVVVSKDQTALPSDTSDMFPQN